MAKFKFIPIIISSLYVFGCAGGFDEHSREHEATDADNEVTAANGESVGNHEQAFTASAVWTAWTTDGSAAATCPAGKAAVGFECSGWYCDDIRLYCDKFPGTLTTPSGDSGWTPYISEESGRNRASCPNGSYVTGVRCTGDWCDNVSFRCSPSNRDRATCADFGSVSEETGPRFVDDRSGPMFITKVFCEGSYCDNKTFEACNLQGRSNSCLGRCGSATPTPSGCYCDEICSEAGDCCTDYVAACTG